jgi:hypothetical protein
MNATTPSMFPGDTGFQAEGLPNDDKTLWVETRMAEPAQHIDTLHKDHLEKAIYDCLTWSRPLHDANHGLKPCTPKTVGIPAK